MASSHQSKVVAKVHVASTSSFQRTDHGRGFRRGPNHEQSNPHKPKDSFRGGPHRGRGTSSHRGHTQKDHTAVKVHVVLDKATISDAAKPYKGSSGSGYRGQYDKPYRGPHQSDRDQFTSSSTEHKPKHPSKVFKSDSSFYNPSREKDQRERSQSRGRGQDRGRGQGRGRGHDRGRGQSHGSRGTGTTPQVIVVNNYIVQESSKKRK